MRTSLRQSLAPGQSERLPVRVEFPRRPGRYILRLSLLQQGCGWFYQANPKVASTSVVPCDDNIMSIQEQVNLYSASVGADPMLIQGAGGNASWKDGGIMWIKASGTWLADAVRKDIFVPIDIARTLELIAEGASDLSSARVGESPLRPSIETCLHALLAQRFVVHFHAIDVIALAAQQGAREEFATRLQGLKWAWVDYIKPGPDLAHAVVASIGDGPTPGILVLGNHGLVVAADSLEELDTVLRDVLRRCALQTRAAPLPDTQELEALAAQWEPSGYILPEQPHCHALALDAVCQKLASSAWVLYPDHAVFLGAHATVAAEPWPQSDGQIRPECVIVPGRGVVVRQDLSAGQLAMLACYADVTLRLADAATVAPLSQSDIADLLNWDAEKYRQSLNTI